MQVSGDSGREDIGWPLKVKKAIGSNNTMGRVFVLHMGDPHSIPASIYSPEQDHECYLSTKPGEGPEYN